MQRIRRFGVTQTAKVVATIYSVLSLIIVMPMMFFSSFSSVMPFGGGLSLIFIPILYWIVTFIMTALGCFVYNIIAERTGGIEIEVEVTDDRY